VGQKVVKVGGKDKGKKAVTEGQLSQKIVIWRGIGQIGGVLPPAGAQRLGVDGAGGAGHCWRKGDPNVA
jgi:hypothetical protein